MARHIIVLEIHDDRDDRTWWEAVGLSDPNTWDVDPQYVGHYPGHHPGDGEVYVSVSVERKVVD